MTNSNGELTFGTLMNYIQNFEDATSMSLFQYTKRSIIQSRVFIENTLANEEILNPLMLNLMDLYTSLIMTATDMNQYVQGSRRVRDVMQVVATESIDEMPRDVQESMDQFFMGTKEPAKMLSIGETEARYGSSQGSQVKETSTKVANLPQGRIIEVKFGSLDKGTFTVNLWLQLSPTFMPPDVAAQFVALNFSPSFRQRWMQATAGEISFIKDLFLSRDIRKKRLKALKQDKSGILKEMIDRQENSLANSWLKLALVTPERQNIANTILIFDKATFDRACSNAGLRFKDFNSRQRFFNKTFSMIVATVDPMYNKIQMYYHGLKNFSEFTFEQVKRNAKIEATDIMAMMKSYAAGMAPKF